VPLWLSEAAPTTSRLEVVATVAVANAALAPVTGAAVVAVIVGVEEAALIPAANTVDPCVTKASPAWVSNPTPTTVVSEVADNSTVLEACFITWVSVAETPEIVTVVTRDGCPAQSKFPAPEHNPLAIRLDRPATVGVEVPETVAVPV
jgi:hypothetical protein